MMPNVLVRLWKDGDGRVFREESEWRETTADDPRGRDVSALGDLGVTEGRLAGSRVLMVSVIAPAVDAAALFEEPSDLFSLPLAEGVTLIDADEYARTAALAEDAERDAAVQIDVAAVDAQRAKRRAREKAVRDLATAAGMSEAEVESVVDGLV